MAVTAAPTGKVYPVAWMSCRKKLQAGFGRYRNRLLISVFQSFNWNDIFITANHVQPGTRRELDSSWISMKLLYLRFQRLVHIPQCLDVRLHCRKLLCGNVNFGACSHVDGHAHSEGREQNHSKNNPGGNYSPAPAHLRARSQNIYRNLLH